MRNAILHTAVARDGRFFCAPYGVSGRLRSSSQELRASVINLTTAVVLVLSA